MNILIVSAVFPPEPIVSASLSKDIASELSKKNDITVICPKPTRPHGFIFENVIEEKDYKVIRLNSYTCSESKIMGRLRESYSFGKHCAQYIVENRDKIDVIYVNTWPLFAQYYAVKAAKKYHIPITIHVQDLYPESMSNKLPLINPVLNFFLLPIDKYVLRNATNIIAISNKMKNYLASTRKINLAKIEVVQNWQDEEAFINYNLSVAQNQSSKNTLTFMYLGNIGPVAGIDFLIDAFASLKADNCKLVIAGSGSMKNDLMEKTRKLKVENIEFISVPDGNVPQIQAMADVLLLPIKKGAASSSIPSKLPAYMFSAKPIIASVDYDSDTAEAIINANCGWIVEPENALKLKDIMQNTLKLSKEERRNMGLKGRDYALEHFSKKSNLPKLVLIIEELIER